MFVQPKADGKRISPLVDLKLRNENTVMDSSAIPNQTQILNAVGRVRFRSKIDLSDAYFQTRLDPESERYNSFKTPFGSFISRVMLQGDMNAPTTFMRIMENLLSKYLHHFVWVYIDDILIFSNTATEHAYHIGLVCTKLREAKFYASRNKSILFADKLDILGYLIDDEGIHAAPGKIACLTE